MPFFPGRVFLFPPKENIFKCSNCSDITSPFYKICFSLRATLTALFIQFSVTYLANVVSKFDCYHGSTKSGRYTLATWKKLKQCAQLGCPHCSPRLPSLESRWGPTGVPSLLCLASCHHLRSLRCSLSSLSPSAQTFLNKLSYLGLFYHFIKDKNGSKFSQIEAARLKGWPPSPPQSGQPDRFFLVFFTPSLIAQNEFCGIIKYM